MNNTSIRGNYKSKINQIALDIWFTINKQSYFPYDASLNQYLFDILKLKEKERNDSLLLLNIISYFNNELDYYGMELLNNDPLLIAMKKEHRH